MQAVNFIQKKSVRLKAWRALSAFVGIVTILNVSMVGALIAPAAASAAVTGSFQYTLEGQQKDLSFTTGNICGGTGGCYAEGENVPFRLTIDGLTVNTTYSAKINLDYKDSAGVEGYVNFNTPTTWDSTASNVSLSSATTSAGLPNTKTYTITFKALASTVHLKWFGLLGNDASTWNGAQLHARLVQGVAQESIGNKEVPISVNKIVPNQCALTFEKVFLVNGQEVSSVNANVGDVLTYKLKFTNTGNQNCTGGGTRVDDFVPAGTTYVAGSATVDGVTADGVPSMMDAPINIEKPNNVKFGYISTTGYGLTPNIPNPDGYKSFTSGTYAGKKLLSWNAHTVVPGQSDYVTFQVKVNTPTSCDAYTIPNYALISADQLPNGVRAPLNSNEFVNANIASTCAPVLTETKTVQNLTHAGAITTANPPHVGDTLQYSLNVQNTGTADKIGYVFSDNIGDVLQYSTLQSPIPNSGSYDAGTTTITWPSTTIPKGSTVNRIFTVKVNDPLPTTGDFTMTNTFGTSTKIVPLCHLVITKWQKTGNGAYTKDPISVSINDVVTYKITVENNGAANCTGGGVKITDQVNSLLAYQTQTPGSGVDYVSNSNGVLTWNANVITPGQTKSVEWTGKVKTPEACGQFSIPNMAKAYADQYHEMNQALESNTVYATGTKLCYGTVKVEKVMKDLRGNEITTDTHSFTVTMNGADAKTIAVGAPATYTNLLTTGSYNVVEGADANYDFVKYCINSTCSTDRSAGITATVTNGQTTTVKVYNQQKPATITITKKVLDANGAVLDDNTSFDLTWTNGTGSVSQDSAFVQNVNPGSAYSFTETPNSMYTVKNGTCDFAAQDVTSNAKLTCEFVNQVKTAKLTVTKVVNNNHNGTKTVTDFPLFIGTTPVTSGDANTLMPNTSGTSYTVSEQLPLPKGYVQTSVVCDNQTTDTIRLLPGDDKSCTITNDDVAPSLTLVKHVSENSPLAASAWWLSATGTNTPLFGTTPVVSTSDFLAGTYTLGETNFPGYTASAWTCDGATVTNGDQITLGVGDVATCSITNTYDPLTINKTVNEVKTNTANPGEVLNYAITITNPGDLNVYNAKIVDTLPSHLTVVPGSISDSGVLGGGMITWENLMVAGHNGTKTVTFQATVDTLMPFGATQLTNTSTLGCSANDDRELSAVNTISNCLWNGSSSTTTTVNASSTILVTKSGAATVVPGNNLVYTIEWSISGNAPVTNATITDALPANTTFVSADCGTTTGTCTPSNAANTETWLLGSRNPGEHGTVTMTVKVAKPLANTTVITNTAVFTTTEVGPVQSTVKTTVQSAPSLSITKSNDLTTFTTPGKTVNYTVVVTNAASATEAANNVVMTDTLPAGFTFAVDGTSTKSFSLGTIAPGASVTTTFLVNISGTQTAGTYVNTAVAKGDNTTQVSATSPVEVRVPQVLGAATPNLTITKTVNKANAKPKDILTYTITVKNIGDGDALNTVITDTLPKNLSFAHGTGRTMTFNIGTLAAGHSRVINVDVRVESDATRGTYVNTATVKADDVPAVSAQAKVKVTVPTVLGLATTGTGLLDYLIGLVGAALVALGVLGIRTSRRHEPAA